MRQCARSRLGHGLPVFSYITSNGTMGGAVAIAGPHSVLIVYAFQWTTPRPGCTIWRGVFASGESDLRPKCGTRSSYFRALGKLPTCRVTVTRDNVDGMIEIARFLLRRAGIDGGQQFEPVYSHPELCPEAEKLSCRACSLHARSLAAAAARRSTRGTDPGEMHGPYCQTLRHVLFRDREWDGMGRPACSTSVRASDSPFCRRSAFRREGDVFRGLSRRGSTAIEGSIGAAAGALQDLAVREHCVRGCPNFCPIDVAYKRTQRHPDSALSHQPTPSRHREGKERARSTALARASDPGELPEVLLDAQRELREQKNVVSNTDQHLAAWEGFVNDLRSRVPSAQVADDGATIYLGKLSRGCSHCKRGSWDCIFVTKRCNLACSFCCSAKTAPREGFASTLGRSVEELIQNYLTIGIGGVSLSGGEALLEPEQTFTLLETFRKRLPDRYLWLYTNGLLLRPECIERLVDVGLDEIRFNAAATAYDDPILLGTIARAAQRIPAVTVEIPAIPDDAARLIACLPTWSNAGVTYLNLHELMRERNSLSAHLQGEFRQVVLADGHVTDISVGSRRSPCRSCRQWSTGTSRSTSIYALLPTSCCSSTAGGHTSRSCVAASPTSAWSIPSTWTRCSPAHRPRITSCVPG